MKWRNYWRVDIWSNIRATLEFRQSNDFKRLHPMTLSTLQDFVDRHFQWVLVRGLEIFQTTPKPGFSGWRDARQLHGSNFLAQFARFVIAIWSPFSCKVRIYNTRGITSPYETPTDSSSHVSLVASAIIAPSSCKRATYVHGLRMCLIHRPDCRLEPFSDTPTISFTPFRTRHQSNSVIQDWSWTCSYVHHV